MKDKQKLYQINLFWQNGWAGSRIVSENLISTADQRFDGDKGPFNAPLSAHAHNVLLCLFLPLLVNRVKSDAAPTERRDGIWGERCMLHHIRCVMSREIYWSWKEITVLGIFEVSQFVDKTFFAEIFSESTYYDKLIVAFSKHRKKKKRKVSS